MNIWDILILAGVAALVWGAFRVWRGKPKGGCGCGCAGCAKACPHRRGGE